MKFAVDDILAALLLSLAMMRRLEVLSISQQDNPHVPAAELEDWRKQALAPYNLTAVACLLKVLLGQLWYFLAFGWGPVPVVVGGVSIFGLWVLALVTAWFRSTEARGLRQRLQLQRPGAKRKP